MVEWFKAAVLKIAVSQVTGGSNPSLSAILFSLPISGKKRIFYSKAIKVIGVNELAKIAEVCLKHTQNLKKGLFQRKIMIPASEF